MLKLKDVIGNLCMGRQGLGTNHFQQWRKADPRQRRDMIQAEVRHLEEERRRSKAVELGSQGAWTKHTGGHTGGVQTALSQRRYRWHHDKVLSEMADILEQERQKKHQTHVARKWLVIKEGDKPPSSKKPPASSTIVGDEGGPGRKLHFPQVDQTSLKPDGVIWSEEAKRIILIELTVPWKDSCEEASERKATK
ncbi:unconventional myosin-If-like protein [Labeo rohita]|uniref:Unconventional myosin-If-like protein n=1 Tax=Labeo rohita TaxID=84645 RepID=A0A498MWQ6_LABRO|nr:unconventional myosin-If-like protein [Labeo rohita]